MLRKASRFFSGMSMLTSEQIQLKEAAAQWVDTSLKPHAAEIDRCTIVHLYIFKIVGFAFVEQTLKSGVWA